MQTAVRPSAANKHQLSVMRFLQVLPKQRSYPGSHQWLCHRMDQGLRPRAVYPQGTRILRALGLSASRWQRDVPNEGIRSTRKP
jgi:hypothetical protein